KKFEGEVVFDPPVKFQRVRGDDHYHADGKPRDKEADDFTEIYPPKGSDLKVIARAPMAPHLKAEKPGVTVAYFTAGMDRWPPGPIDGKEWIHRLHKLLKVREIDWKTQMLIYVTPEGKGGPGCAFQVESIKKEEDKIVVRCRYDASTAPPKDKYAPPAGELLLVEKAKGEGVYEPVGGKLLPLERKKGVNHPEFGDSDLKVSSAIQFRWLTDKPAQQRIVRAESDTHGFKPLNPTPAMSDDEMKNILRIDRVPDFHTQML